MIADARGAVTPQPGTQGGFWDFFAFIDVTCSVPNGHIDTNSMFCVIER